MVCFSSFSFPTLLVQRSKLISICPLIIREMYGASLMRYIKWKCYCCCYLVFIYYAHFEEIKLYSDAHMRDRIFMKMPVQTVIWTVQQLEEDLSLALRFEEINFCWEHSRVIVACRVIVLVIYHHRSGSSIELNVIACCIRWIGLWCLKAYEADYEAVRTIYFTNEHWM